MCREPTDIFTFHETIVNGTTNTLTGLLLVTIVASAVKKTITNFDSVVNHLQTDINGRLQQIV